MTLAIVQQCTKTQICSCILDNCLALYALISALVLLYCMRQIYLQMQRLSFEQIPLLSSLINCLFQLFLTFFSASLILLLTNYYLQAVTFTIIGQSLIELYYRVAVRRTDKLKKLILYVKIGCIIYFLYLGLAWLLCAIGVIAITSDNWLLYDYSYINLGQLFGIVIFLIYGIRLLKKVKMYYGA